MKKRVLSALLVLCMALSLLPTTALALAPPAETDYWKNLNRAQVVRMLDRIAAKAEDRDVILVCYPTSGAAYVTAAIAQFPGTAASKRAKVYGYAFTPGDSATLISEALSPFLEGDPGTWDWPVAVTYSVYNESWNAAQHVSTWEVVGTYDGNGLYNLMMENGVTTSTGSDPYPETGSEPDPDPEPDTPSGPDSSVPAPTPVLPDGMDDASWDVLRLTNQHRMAQGLEPLSTFTGLQDVANLRAEEISYWYRSDHSRPDGTMYWTAYPACGVFYHYNAENIASGQRTSASVVSSWLNSPGHRRNIESGRSLHMGVGHVYRENPSAGRDNWTQNFAWASDCQFTGLALSASVIPAIPGADLETLVHNVTVTASCRRHGLSYLPLIEAMITNPGDYDPYAAADQALTVAYGGKTTTLTVAAAHDWDGGKITRAPTCTEQGEMAYTCAVCGAKWTESIPALGHIFENGSPVCSRGDTALDAALGEELLVRLAPERGTPWTEEAAMACAEEAVLEVLRELTGAVRPPYGIEIHTVAFEPPGIGLYGYYRYTVTLAPLAARSFGTILSMAEQALPVCQLDLPPEGAVSDHTYSDSVPSCTVTFDAAGGTPDTFTMSTGSGGTLSSLPVPARAGYLFDGWYTAPSGGTRITTSTVFSADTTVYAHWSSQATGSGGGSAGWSSGAGSSGGSAPASYEISIPSASGGSVDVQPRNAAQGRVVTVTAVPDAGYALAGLTVSDSQGTALTLNERSEGVYTFVMPAGEVSVQALFQPVPEAAAPWSNPFSDVAPEAWYYSAVQFAALNGLMNGYSSDTFAPDAELSRAMLAEILYNLEGRPTAASAAPFTDVSGSAWYADAVAWAVENGIVLGYEDGTFKPDDPITREQFAVMLWRYCGKPDAANTALPFSDRDAADAYALEALCWAAAAGIVNGYSGNFLEPKGLTTRAQAAQMLQNYIMQ